MKDRAVLLVITALFLISLISASSFVDDTAGEFNSGTHNNTLYNTTGGYLQLNLTTSNGTFVSQVFNGSPNATWDDISWIENITTDINTLNDLVLYYKLDDAAGSIKDSSGLGQNATYSGALYSQVGMINTSIGFDGFNDKIYYDKQNWKGNFTISYWFKEDVIGQADFSSIISSSDAGGAYTFQIDVGDASNCCDNQFRLLGTTTSSVTFTMCMLEENTNWNYLTISKNGTSLKGYINGTLVNTTTQSFDGLFNKYGVKYERLVSGPYKDAGTPFKNLTSSERALIQSKIDKINEMFIQHVSERRGRTNTETRAVATGEIFLGAEALELGLVDTLGGKDEAIELAGTLSGVGDSQTVRYEKTIGLFERLVALTTVDINIKNSASNLALRS